MVSLAHAAARRRDPGIVRLLLHAGASVTSRNDVGQTPLITYAAQITSHTPRTISQGKHPRVEAFRMLLEAGSDVNATDAHGRTALHVLAANHNADPDESRLAGARLLLLSGVDVSARDVDGMTAPDLLPSGDTKLAQLLTSGGGGEPISEEGLKDES